MNDRAPRKLLYYRSWDQIQAWRREPVADNFAKQEAQAEFFHEAMPERSKKIRDKLKG